MSKQIEQTLYSLMPQYGTDLPQPLVDLAGSILAQSRFKASTLKAEEEVARLYACAHIACDRLKISLDLPPIQPRPPIPPRNYKKLYTHLDGIIPQSGTPAKTRSGRTQTPSSKALGHATSETPTGRSRGTPSKEQALAQWRTPSKGDTATPTRSSARRNAGPADAKLRPWVKPVIRFVCAEAKQDKLASSLVAGMEAITIPGGRESTDEWIWENYTALFSAICYWVFARAKAATTGHPIPREPAYQQRREILSLLTQARKTVTVPGLDDEEMWKYWADLKPKDFTGAVATIADRSWLGDWWKGVDDVVNSPDWNEVPRDEEDTDLAAPIRVRRADTMFQDQFDYLSDSRKAEFKTWKQDMLMRIQERQAGVDAMEIDTQ